MALISCLGIDDSIIINNNKYELNLEFSRVLRWYEMWKDPDLSGDGQSSLFYYLTVSIPWSDDPPTSIENLVSIIPQDDLVPLSNAIIKRIARASKWKVQQ